MLLCPLYIIEAIAAPCRLKVLLWLVCLWVCNSVFYYMLEPSDQALYLLYCIYRVVCITVSVAALILRM
jgi:hypothetical protein